jgi:hypothetical protein
MTTINSRVNGRIDRMLGYLGLFLIGLIGWVCDRAAFRLPARQRTAHDERSGGAKPPTSYRSAARVGAGPLRHRSGEHAGLVRK